MNTKTAIRTALANATPGTLFRTDITVKTIYLPVDRDYDPAAVLFTIWKLGEEVLGEGIITTSLGRHHKIILAA